jgi:uncharacterized membrane protein (UPF0127 family)
LKALTEGARMRDYETAFFWLADAMIVNMAYPIDIAFIDRDGNILARYENVCPWRMCSCPGAWAVLERPSIIVSTPALQRVPA